MIDDFGIYEYGLLHGCDLNKISKSGLKNGDLVILKPKVAHQLYDDCQIRKNEYKEIHQNNIRGRIIDIREVHNHYCWGEYARIEWDNGSISDSIHTSWLKKYEN